MTPPGPTTPRRTLAIIALVALLLAGWWTFDARIRLQRIEDQTRGIQQLIKEVERLEQGVQLLRAEQQADAVGTEAILDRLRLWAPKLQHAGTPAPELIEIQKRVDALMRAAKALGPDAAPPFAKAFHASRSGEDDELRKWILRALVQADPSAGQEILAQALRGLQFPVSTRIREFAADELLRLDPETAGRLLRDILHYESSRGIDADRIPQDYRSRFPEAVYAHTGNYPGFFNLVARYGESNDPERVPTLIMLLGRQSHDLATIQEAVKQLGALKAVAAVPEIQRLYLDPPGIPDNPIFKNHCLEALDRIQGSGALPFFRDQQRIQSSPIVAEKLKALLSKHGG